MVYKQSGSKNWWYKFVWDGKRIRESTRQPVKRVAEQMEAAHKASLAKAEVGIREKKPIPTFEQFAADRVSPFRRFEIREQNKNTGVLPEWRQEPFGLRLNRVGRSRFHQYRRRHRIHRQTPQSGAEGEQHQSRTGGPAADVAPRIRVGCSGTFSAPGPNATRREPARPSPLRRRGVSLLQGNDRDRQQHSRRIRESDGWDSGEARRNSCGARRPVSIERRHNDVAGLRIAAGRILQTPLAARAGRCSPHPFWEDRERAPTHSANAARRSIAFDETAIRIRLLGVPGPYMQRSYGKVESKEAAP